MTMRKLSVIPAVLSSLLLAAHFLRAGNPVLCTSFVLLPFLLTLRHRWTTRAVQLVLLAGATVWLWTMVNLADSFQQANRAPGRMIVIMTSVAAFTALSAALLQLLLPGPILRNSPAA
jgi:hypothetical protein